MQVLIVEEITRLIKHENIAKVCGVLNTPIGVFKIEQGGIEVSFQKEAFQPLLLFLTKSSVHNLGQSSLQWLMSAEN